MKPTSTAGGTLLALALGGIVVLAGCAGSGPLPADSTSTFSAIQEHIFSVNCLASGCHNGTDQAGSLVLETERSFGNLVGVVPANPAANAKGLRRVEPGNPDQSFLLIKLTGPGSGEGSQMPLGFPLLSTADIEQIRAWILSGAPGPGGPTATDSTTPAIGPTELPAPFASPTPSVATGPTKADTAPPTVTPTGTRLATLTPTNAPPTISTPTATPTASATATPSPMPTPTFSVDSTLPQIQATIFDASCINVGCHNAADRAGNQVLEVGLAFNDLVAVAPTNAAAQTAGLLRVTPGAPDQSFLVAKIMQASAFDPNFGSRMPLGKPQLEPVQIEHIRAWILRGALPDESAPSPMP